ncbi:hypothetical protein CSC18_1378 [Klebsiella aerogenes]|nr:hypothetical protein CSC18_1378 [Klebsiella aerogenes]
MQPAFYLFTTLADTTGDGDLKIPRWRCRLPGLQHDAIW